MNSPKDSVALRPRPLALGGLAALALLALTTPACTTETSSDEDGASADSAASDGSLLDDAFGIDLAEGGDSASSPARLPADFASKDAQTKQALVWQKLTADSELRCGEGEALASGGGDRLVTAMARCRELPKATIVGNAGDVTATITRAATDAIFRGWERRFGIVGPAFDDGAPEQMTPGRRKLFHAFGAVAKVELRTEASTPYTGLLEGSGSGATKRAPAVGLARISAGGPATILGGFVPGMGLKFFVAGQDSIDMQVMHGMRGQGDGANEEGANPFARPFSNVFETEGATMVIKVGMRALNLVHSPSNKLPLDQTAFYSWNGSKSLAPVAPNTLSFRPLQKDAAIAYMRRAPGADFRTILAAVTKDAGEGDAAVPLYKVVDQGGRVVATLVATSPFIASRWGDRNLYFRHHHGCSHPKYDRGACGGSMPVIKGD